MTIAGLDMMSRFSIFKKLKERQWIRFFSKLAIILGEDTAFSADMLSNTLKISKLLERSAKKTVGFLILKSVGKEFTEKSGYPKKTNTYHLSLNELKSRGSNRNILNIKTLHASDT